MLFDGTSANRDRQDDRTLFPLLKATPTKELDKIFYLAPRLPGANWRSTRWR